MTDFPPSTIPSNFCTSNDFSCAMQQQPFCSMMLKSHSLFSGRVTQKIIEIFDPLFSNGFCSLPHLQWKDAFMLSKEHLWGGAILNIEPQDLSAPIMRGVTSFPFRLFLVIQTDQKVISTLFQDATELNHPWHLGTPSLKNYIEPKEEGYFIGPFDTIPPVNYTAPVCSLENTCLKILSSLAEKHWVIIETFFQEHLNGTIYPRIKNYNFSLSSSFTR